MSSSPFLAVLLVCKLDGGVGDSYLKAVFADVSIDLALNLYGMAR